MKSPSPTPQIAVIGGGPAGLMATERLATAGFAVTIYDRMPTVGRKFLMAGRGGLNLTHSEGLDALDIFMARYGGAAAWLKPMIENFSPAALREWCETLGQETFVGSSGRIFPKEMKASPLLRVWLRRLDSLGVAFALRHVWRGWDARGDLHFVNEAGADVLVKADATVLALGGASWPRLGSDGGWVDILRGAGVAIADLRPANCGFVAPWSDVFGERFAGAPLKPVTLSFGGRAIQGEAMITARGLEGGAVYVLSGALRDAIAEKGEAVLSVDLRPSLTIDEIIKRLNMPRGSQSTSTFLRKAVGLSPAAIGLMREGFGVNLPVEATALAGLIKNTQVPLSATTPIAQAISSAGGVARDAVDARLMLKTKPGIFVCGEMLDWEAPTGGYLLQACFSSGCAAARGVEEFLG